MSRSSDWKRNAFILLLALGVAALYGSATALVLWILGFSEAVEIGGIVSTVTGGLALLVALFAIIYFASENNFKKPPRWIDLPFMVLACTALFFLILPPTILTLGRFWRWLSDEPKLEEI